MLLERNNVNPDTTDEDGRTPLSWAAGGGHKKIVRILFERDDVNPHSADKSGRTPLSWATGNGSEKIVRMHLERRGAHPSLGDESGETSSTWTTESEGEESVDMLANQSIFYHNRVPAQTTFPWTTENDCAKVVPGQNE